MSFNPKKGYCLCERCGHDWQAKPTADGKFVEPRSCAKCKSIGWNRPRVYAGKYTRAVMAQRSAPTGRAAAKQNPISEETKWEKINALLDEMTPEEREAAWKIILLHEYGRLLDELGLR